MRYPSAVLSFITGPIRVDKSNDGNPRLVLTHLQKYSHFGFMLTWPFCFHFWLFWKLQATDPWAGNWLPGTEQGIYFRTPGWRWDADLGMKWTWGYFGLHLD
jgi:hypothetical protein